MGSTRGPGFGKILLISALTAVAIDCSRREAVHAPGSEELFLAQVDTVLGELGGLPTETLDRGQRWRMVSSMGSGLPPSHFRPANLPERGSRGAALLQAYCVQCHGLPAPQMHAAAEWPVLVRRMVMRAQTLHDRMGGPMTRGMLGPYLLSGMASAQIPAVEDVDSLNAYLQRHAMPVAVGEDIGSGLEWEFFVSRCGFCHETPSPRAHTAEEWPAVVDRMTANMALMSVRPLTDDETRRILAFLTSSPR